MGGLTTLFNRAFRVFGAVLACGSLAHSQPNVHVFTLSDTTELVPVRAQAEAVEYKGRKAVRTNGFTLLRGTDFQDGIIEADIALKTTAPPGMRMPGFLGIAFRARPDASRYELFYVRPGNSNSDDQAMRNHSVQYTSEPNFPWANLRRAWPWIYEAHADLAMETWTKLRIEVKGRSARLYLHGSPLASLVVDGLKGEDLRGGVALWGFPLEEAYFSNIRITNSAPLSVKNGADASGAWQVTFSSDVGAFQGALDLKRDGSKLSGSWSGGLGAGCPVSGTWRDGYIELSFQTELPGGRPGNPGGAFAFLAGWIDGDRGSGRMRVEGSADGVWTGTRKP